MIEIVIAFFKTGLGKSLLVGLSVAVLMWGIYEKGNVDGRERGYKEGMAALQPQVDTLTNTINSERTATENKVSKLEKEAADDLAAAKAQEVIKIQTRDKIVDHYNTVEKVVQGQCGLSKVSVDAVNELLDTQLNFDTKSGD